MYVSKILGLLYVEKNFKLCEFPDEDPLDLCKPVNCHMKYQGHRSYFNYTKRQCVPIPICNDTLSIKSPYNKVIITIINIVTVLISIYKYFLNFLKVIQMFK